MKKLLYTLLLSIGGMQLANAQCTVTASAGNTTIPCNGCTTLSVSGVGNGSVAFQETFNSGSPTGWSFTQSVTIANNTCGVPSPDGTPFMWMGAQAANPRDMTTVSFDLSLGGQICFEMRYAEQGDPSPCEGPDEPDEGVYLQYSIDNGATWVTINYWDPYPGTVASLINWGNYCENIPAAAQTTNTMIRWHQDAVSANVNDHWGIDNVQITLTDPNYQITWDHDGYSLGTGNYVGTNPTPVCPDTTTSYSVTMTNGTYTCTDTVTINISYPNIFNVVANDPTCGNTNGNLNVLVNGGAGGYQYSINNGTTFQGNAYFSNLGPNTYYIQVIDQNSCTDEDTVTLTGVQPMDIVSVDSVNTSCGESDGEVSFIVTGGTPGYQYSVTNGTNLQNDSLFQNLAAGTYTIYASDVNGCFITDTVHVQASGSPSIDSTDLVNEQCDLANGQILVYASGGLTPYTYNLDNSTGQAGSTFANLSAGTYEVFVVDQDNCQDSLTVSITNTPAPTMVMTDTSVCDFGFYVSGTQSQTGSIWSANDTTVHFQNNNSLNPYINSNTSGTYTITFQDTVCNFNQSFDVFFIPYPYTQINDTTICLGETYTLNALDYPNNDNYTWSTGDVNTTAISIGQPGLYIVTTSNNCGTHSDSAYIEMILCDIEVPNVFTPNGDMVNDVFKLINHSGIKSLTCVIVNRWGNTVAEFSDPAFVWDGKDGGGNELGDGTYFYKIIATTEADEELEKQGMVQLVRNK